MTDESLATSLFFDGPNDPFQNDLQAQELPEEPKTRTQKRAQSTRKKLMAAALNMFCERGVEATTIEDITERADVGKGTFYRHFVSKAEVVSALVEDSVERLLKLMHNVKKPQQNLQELLERLFEAHARFFMNNRENFLLLFHGRLLTKQRREQEGGLGQIFNRYMQDIENQLLPFVSQPVTQEQAHMRAFAVAGLVSGVFSFALIGMNSDELKNSLKALRRAFVSGCQAFLAENL